MTSVKIGPISEYQSLSAPGRRATPAGVGAGRTRAMAASVKDVSALALDPSSPPLDRQPQRGAFPLTLELEVRGLPEKPWVKISQIRTLSVERIGAGWAALYRKY